MTNRLRRVLCIVLMLLSMASLLPVAQAEIDYLAAFRERNSFATIITQSRDKGSCRMLRGDITVSVILVGNEDAPWTLPAIGTLHTIVDEALATMETEAAAYNVPLALTPVYYRITAGTDPDEPNWLENALSAITDLEYGALQGKPLLFAMNVDGRSFARTGMDHEHVIFYMERDAGTVRHELLHLFGAEDFYFHDEVEAAAERYFANSVMINSESYSVTDPLTAYLVGWVDEPDEVASAFLDEIAHLTNSEVEEARSADQETGTGVFERENGMYYGMLESGCYNGQGLLEWTSGMSYVGDWAWNNFEGRGTLTWPDGDYYTGDFNDDKRTGKGTYVWTSGMTYTGDFIDGQRTGTGTLTWPGGDSYTGDFVSGKRTGKGTFTWSNGKSYTGEFLEDAITGTGMMTFANGDIYLGQFENGSLHGMGTMYYADGTVKTGKWENDVFVGD